MLCSVDLQQENCTKKCISIVIVSTKEKGSKRTKRNGSKLKVFLKKKENVWSQNKEQVGGAIISFLNIINVTALLLALFQQIRILLH